MILADSTYQKLPPCAATIGCFDGVHRGHRFLIRQVCETAKREGLRSLLVTFPVHPRQVMQADYQPQLLSCLKQKEDLLEQSEADYCILLPFTRELSRLTARDFMCMLHERYTVQTLIIGYDHRFGHNRSEGFEDYCRYGKELGMKIIRARALTERGTTISSTVIRDLLKKGKTEQANHFLGYPYYISGTVVDGYKVGRRLGFPTANLKPSCPEKLIPEIGVYAVHVYLGENRHKGMLNIGRRPTLDNGPEISIEVHILDFHEDIYYKEIKIEFVSRIRPEMKFNGLDELTAQLESDRTTVREVLSKQPLPHSEPDAASEPSWK